ncbi:unnamed protein product [Penicillium viridicatum]
MAQPAELMIHPESQEGCNDTMSIINPRDPRKFEQLPAQFRPPFEKDPISHTVIASHHPVQCGNPPTCCNVADHLLPAPYHLTQQ